MSMICENTFIVKNCQYKEFRKHLLSRKHEMRINGLKTIYKDKDYALLVFDSNGEPQYYPNFTDAYEYGETSYEMIPETYSTCYDCLPNSIADMIKSKLFFPNMRDKKRAKIIEDIEYTV